MHASHEPSVSLSPLRRRSCSNLLAGVTLGLCGMLGTGVVLAQTPPPAPAQPGTTTPAKGAPAAAAPAPAPAPPPAGAQAPPAPPGPAPAPAAGQGYPPAPGYPPPAPYGQAPPGYGAPPPGYAPGYGPPPPGYGAYPPGYGPPPYGYPYGAPYYSYGAPMPPAAPPVKKERRNTGMMIAGILLTSGGAVGLIIGAAVTANAANQIDVYCPNGSGSTFQCSTRDNEGQKTAGYGIMIGSAIALAGGIPLWIVGGQKVPVKDKGESPGGGDTPAPEPDKTSAVPAVLLGPGAAALKWTF